MEIKDGILQERPAGDGLDREAVRRRAEAARSDAPLGTGATTWRWAYADDVPALLAALEAAEERLAESVPRSALVEAHPFWPSGHASGCEVQRGRACDCTARRATYYRLRTEGGAS